MGQRIPGGLYLPTVIAENMRGLGGLYGIQGHFQISGSGILHPDGDFKTAAGQAMGLIFHGSGTDGHIAQDIFQIRIVSRIEHFVGGRQV